MAKTTKAQQVAKTTKAGKGKKANKKERVMFAQVVKDKKAQAVKAITKANAQKVYDLRVQAKKAERAEDYNEGARLWNQAWDILNKLGVSGTMYKVATAAYGIRKVR